MGWGVETVIELEKLGEYVRGAHHTSNDDNLSAVLHQIAHRIDGVVAELKVIFALKPNYIGQRGIPFPVDTNPTRE